MRPPVATVKQFDFSSEPRTPLPNANETAVSPPVENAPVEDGAAATDQVIRITIPAQQSREPAVTTSKQASSKQIVKEKGYKRTKAINSSTGRQNQVLQCLACEKKFSKLCNVLDHVRTHAGERPYACTICFQTFAQRGNRDRHQKMQVCSNRGR